MKLPPSFAHKNATGPNERQKTHPICEKAICRLGEFVPVLVAVELSAKGSD
jgi:hypothetical protein